MPSLSARDLLKRMKLKINLKTTGVPSTPALADFVNSKIAQLERFLENYDEVLVVVEIGKTTAHHRSGEIFRAEINLTAAGKHFRVVKTADDLYAAIDVAKDELLYQLRQSRDKNHTLLVRGGRKIKNILRGLKPWR